MNREYVVYLTNGETVEPDICKSKANGWLYCCWTDNDAYGGTQRTYPPHAVQSYESLPVADEAEVLEA
jgi:hypothetical protein